jgi:transketolase
MTLLEANEQRDLAAIAKNVRRKVLAMASGRGQGYVGQGLGVADILVALYFYEMNYDPSEPTNPARDRFILSTGHYSIALFAVLAEIGVLDEEELGTYGEDGSRLEMSSMGTTPGVEVTGGSLGHGLGVATGMAIGARMMGQTFRIFNLLSDGELQEGSTWEAAMLAGDRHLSGLTALVDVNRTQADGDLVVEVEPVKAKFEAFGWWATEVDGNDLAALTGALGRARAETERPKVVVCHTRLGAGVPLVMQRERAHFVRIGDDEWALAARQLEGGE